MKQKFNKFIKISAVAAFFLAMILNVKSNLNGELALKNAFAYDDPYYTGTWNEDYVLPTGTAAASDDTDESGEPVGPKDHITSGTITVEKKVLKNTANSFKEGLSSKLSTKLSGKFYVTSAEIQAAVSTALESVTTTSSGSYTIIKYTETYHKNECFGKGKCSGEFNNRPIGFGS